MSALTTDPQAPLDGQPASSKTPRPTVAMVGNPNTGKSALFNRLTGSKQRVGNFPGLTVEKRLGQLTLPNQIIDIIDLPGLYSLDAISEDEWIVHKVLHGQAKNTPRPAAVVCILDAGNLKRNLFLASQVAQTKLPMIVVLNMADEAARKGLTIDHQLLAKRLGVPVLLTAATKGQGVDALKQAIADILKNPMHATLLPEKVTAIERYQWIDQLLDGVVQSKALRPQRRESIDALLTHRVFGLLVFLGVMYLVFTSIYTLAGPMMDGIDWLFAKLSDLAASGLQDMPILQSLVTDGIIAGVGGVVIFLPQILILFFFIALLEDTGYMSRTAFLMDRLFSWSGMSGKSFVPLLSSYACAVPGIMAGRTIEDNKARLTTIFIAPLMSCSARLPIYVLLIGAFIEPHYGAWIAGLVLFGMHFLGLIIAMPIAWLINRVILRGKGAPFVLELPPYRLPAMRDVIWRMFERGREFVVRAGTVIFAMSIIIWALCYFPRPEVLKETYTQNTITQIAMTQNIDPAQAAMVLEQDEALSRAMNNQLEAAYLEQSYMGKMGKTIQPVFAPAGFDWKITVGILASFPAREVLISTMGIIYGIGQDAADDPDAGLLASMQNAQWEDGTKVYTMPVVIGVMVFFALCLQCASTVVVLAKESNWKWALACFVYMTVLAWVGAVVTYQVGSLLT